LSSGFLALGLMENKPINLSEGALRYIAIKLVRIPVTAITKKLVDDTKLINSDMVISSPNSHFKPVFCEVKEFEELKEKYKKAIEYDSKK